MSQQQTEKINNEKQNPEEEIEEQETQSVDGSSSSEPTLHSSIASETNDVFYNQTVNDIRLTLKGLNTRQLPSWDHNKKKRDSIKEHLLTAKELGKRLQWSDKELANEVMLSLTGESGTIARQLSQDIQNNFRLLEKELMKFFWVPKPKSQMLKEFNTLVWNPDRQKLQEFAVSLRGKLLKIFRGDTEEFNLKLRDRFIEAIKEVRPDFGRTFEMLDLDQKTEFWNLAIHAQRKYDLYQNNTERIEEDHALLTRDLYAEEMEKPNKQQSKWNAIQNQEQQRFQPIHKDDDFYGPGYRYQYDQAYNGPNFEADSEYDRFYEINDGIDGPNFEKSKYERFYGIDDGERLDTNSYYPQYIEQDFEPNLKENTQLRYTHERDNGEDDDYFKQNEGQNRYYSPNHGSMHSYYNDDPVTNDQNQENDFCMSRSM